MEDCPDMIDYFHGQARVQVHLAVLAQASAVAAMHIDLAQLCETQARAAEEFCDED